MRILTLFLVAGALLAALRQPAFLTFGAFAAVGGGVIIWHARERESDRRRLSEFVLNAFPRLSPRTGRGPDSAKPRLIARWTAACAVAAALGASMSYFSVASGPPRVLADGVLIGTLGALALGPVVRRWYWVTLSIIGIGLGLVAAVFTVGLALGFLGNAAATATRTRARRAYHEQRSEDWCGCTRASGCATGRRPALKVG